MSATLTPNINIGAAVAVKVGTAVVPVKSGSIERKSTLVEVTNSTSGGYRQFRAGLKGAEFNAELVYNGDSPPAIVEGTEVTVIFDSVGYEASDSLANATTTPMGRLITTQVTISSVKDSWSVDGDFGVSITGSSTGIYTVVDTATGATSTT